MNFTFIKFIAILLVLFSGCRQKNPARVVDRSFYYWKSTFTLGAFEQKALNDLQIKRLYLKFFDITWNIDKNAPAPAAIVKFSRQPVPDSLSIIPTVFITNDCMQKMTADQAVAVADKILILVKYIASTKGINDLPEIQIDCDWNEATKDKYFLLLKTIKKLMLADKKLISATVRLHQYKYFKKLGVPPVDRGLLMCYNMGNLKTPGTRNSILEPSELQNYVGGISAYPLPLDIALPLFSWKVLFRNKKYFGLISELHGTSLANNPAIRKTGNTYEILKNTTVNGYSFLEGDILRAEEITYPALLESTDILAKKLKTQHLAVALYHLDSITLSKFATNELETIFDHLR